mmetsp:Transcript_5544/g.8057  ORF Transcript_5544/g.8057 Transcript_5544/m.8057 type:complete len:369 (-) Transcript_5544:239-1345(-)
MYGKENDRKNTEENLSSMKKANVPGVKDGWFSETDAMWPGQKFSLALEGFSEDEFILFNDSSKFQHILVFQSAQHGNVLVLDGVIQMTERDEFVYHEMISNLPLFSHPNPKRVLIVGGGDGGVLREVCRHDVVEHITLVEIDKKVINVCKQFFSESTATSFDDPRLTIVHEDAAEFLRQKGFDTDDNDSGYDVIIADTSDPVGPAESLFDPEFYERMSDALNDGGIICAQAESFWTHLDLIADVVECCADIFESVEYASTTVPTYPCGQIGFILASKGSYIDFAKPNRTPSHAMMQDMQWYNSSIHKASLVLPQFLQERLAPLKPTNQQQNGTHEYPDNFNVYDDDDNYYNSSDENSSDCLLSKCTIS